MRVCRILAAEGLIPGLLEIVIELPKFLRRPTLGLQATPTENNQPMRAADFPNLAAALDYAALGQTGSNFYNGRGKLYAVLSYAQLRAQALQLARRLRGLNAERGARLAIIADTHPDFCVFSLPASTPGWYRYHCQFPSTRAGTRRM